MWQAARQVWQSGFSDTVATCHARKTGAEAEGPAVIVQRMIAATAADVLFSADPVTGQRDHVVLSAIAGLGDRLVSGEADGDYWAVGPTTTGPATPTVLTRARAEAVADIARRAEAAFGTPQDIEWAFDAQSLHILQSRPITTSLQPLPRPDTQPTIFDNSNIVASYPGMVNPLTYSVAVHVYARVYRAFVALLGVPDATITANAAVFGNMLGRVDGRVYYNLVNWYRALALLPKFAHNRTYMETMMGFATPMPAEVVTTIGPPIAKRLTRAVEYLRLIKVAGSLIWQVIRLPHTKRRFYDRLNAALNSGFDPRTAGPTALAADYRRTESTLVDRWDAPLVNDFLCMIAFGASRNLMQRWLGPQGLTLHNAIMIGQSDIISAEPAQRIGHIGQMVAIAGLTGPLTPDALQHHPAIAAEIQSYLTKFGDRCTEELKLESIALTDDPLSLLHAITASAGRAMPPETKPQDPDCRALFPNPVNHLLAKAVLDWTRARVRDRENLRFEHTRIFGHTR
ncbi:MAG: phosphoenolpyruvate synthase, partial [Candidatus Saccharibacteria bacterium]|nr:phosphoenolpyruvate synthase [Pseudorhodobacter sp.]